ncbi:MFS transporter [Stakelama tenebrarum]|uniref:MFS transporter n=1 Tax=Stakelama tenebrarum TaxID=2711215 RepID=A0A6G6Y4P8_9SPHN|nr:MFS transporter [Sphingosinithalassobacter tenebrarum]QIG79821.1 MFS transporter [Sphingosinithalassobacter tenebrarum]
MTRGSPAAARALAQGAGKTATLIVACAATALVLVIFTVPVTTVTGTAAQLGAGPGAQAWILSAMSVGAAAGLLASGAIGDDYGRRRTFVWGMAVMAIASVVGALAGDPMLLILARVAQGLGGAAVLACGLGLIGSAFPGDELPHASGIWAASLGAGVAAGPILTSGLDALGGWTAPYWASAVASAALGVAGRMYLAESRAANPRRIDLAGTLLLSAGLACLLAGMTQSRTGLSQPLVWLLIGGGVALLAGFVAVEARIAGPMLDLRLFRSPDFVGATVAALASGAGVLALMSLIPTVLERGYGVSPLAAAVMLLAWSGTTAIAAIGVRWLPLSPRVLLIGGLTGCAIGQLATYGLTRDGSALILLPGMFLCGIANGVLNAALGRQAVASVPADRSAMGSGANNTARYLGSGTGLTIAALLITHAGSAGGVEGLLAGWRHAVLVSAVFSAVGALVVFLARDRTPRRA